MPRGIYRPRFDYPPRRRWIGTARRSDVLRRSRGTYQRRPRRTYRFHERWIPSAVSGTIKSLSGATTITFTPSVQLVATKVLSGATNIVFTETATLVATKVLAPTANIVFSETATLVATKVLQATTHITFTVSATLSKISASATYRVVAGVIPAIMRRLHRRPFD